MRTKWWTRLKFLSEIFGGGENERKNCEILDVKKLHIPTVPLCIFIRIWMYTLICFGVSSSILDHLKSIALVKMNIKFLIYLEITFNYLYLVLNLLLLIWIEWSRIKWRRTALNWVEGAHSRRETQFQKHFFFARVHFFQKHHLIALFKQNITDSGI